MWEGGGGTVDGPLDAELADGKQFFSFDCEDVRENDARVTLKPCAKIL